MHSVYTRSNALSSLYLWQTQPQGDYLWSPHINLQGPVNQWCKFSGEIDRPVPGCGFGGCHSRKKWSYPDVCSDTIWLECFLIVVHVVVGGVLVPVYLKLSLPAALTTTTALVVLSATQMSKFLYSLRRLLFFIRWIVSLALVVPLNVLYLCWTRVWHNFWILYSLLTMVTRRSPENVLHRLRDVHSCNALISAIIVLISAMARLISFSCVSIAAKCWESMSSISD